MSKKLMTALLLIALTVIVLLLNARDSMTLNLGIAGAHQASAAMIYLGFAGVGVVVGLLLR